MPPSLVHGTPLAADLHATLQEELGRIEALQEQLKERKEALVRNANLAVPLPPGVCLVWEQDLVNECHTHVWDICSSEQRVMSTALMGIGKPHEGCIPAGAGTDICSSEQRVVIVV